MENMMLCFLRLMEIITAKNNCSEHYEPLRKLIVRFNLIYSLEDNKHMKRESDVLTYTLQAKLKMIHEKELG